MSELPACATAQCVTAERFAAQQVTTERLKTEQGAAHVLSLPPLVRRIYKQPQALVAPERRLYEDGWLMHGYTHGPVTRVVGP